MANMYFEVHYTAQQSLLEFWDCIFILLPVSLYVMSLIDLQAQQISGLLRPPI